MKKFTLSILKLSLFLAIGAVGFSSCGDDDDSGATPDNRNRTQFLTDTNWKTTSLQYDSTGTSSDIDFYAGADACDKDDQFNFDASSTTATNGAFTWTEGASKCDPANPDTVATGTWAFSNTAQTKMMLPHPFDGSTVDWDILELTASTTRLRYSPNTSESWTWVFSH